MEDELSTITTPLKKRLEDLAYNTLLNRSYGPLSLYKIASQLASDLDDAKMYKTAAELGKVLLML